MSKSVQDSPIKIIIQHEPDMHMLVSSSIVQEKKRRKVKFSTNPISHSHEAPKHTIASLWYSSADKERFKRQTRRERIAFQRMRKDEEYRSKVKKSLHRHGMCPVGLEQHLISDDYARQRAITHRLVMLVVLREQVRPVSQKDYDREERIANVSRKHSEWSRAQAREIGLSQAIISGGTKNEVTATRCQLENESSVGK